MSVKMNKYILIGLLQIGFFAACKVSKDTPVPKPELPAAFGNSTTTDTASIASLPWESFLPTLP